MTRLWVEDYRPRSVEDYVWASDSLKTKVTGWIKEGTLPNLLFSGGAGRGKTTLARLLMIALNIPRGDILDINASLERRVDGFTDTITGFSSTWAMGPTGMKYVILDEADRLSALSQDFLRNQIESDHETCRYILTVNDRSKISPYLHSRLQEFELTALDRDEAILRAADILVSEKIEFDPLTLIKYVDAYHPDLRKCINVLQQRCDKGKLLPFSEAEVGHADYLIEILTHLVSGQSRDVRRVLRDRVSADDYLSVFRFIFSNVEVFDGDDLQDSILIAIRDGIWRHGQVADASINMEATLTEIAQLTRRK